MKFFSWFIDVWVSVRMLVVRTHLLSNSVSSSLAIQYTEHFFRWTIPFILFCWFFPKVIQCLGCLISFAVLSNVSSATYIHWIFFAMQHSELLFTLWTSLVIFMYFFHSYSVISMSHLLCCQYGVSIHDEENKLFLDSSLSVLIYDMQRAY